MFAKTPIEPNAIYTREETAQLLSISLSTLKQLIRTGQLRVSQPSGLRRVFIRGTSIMQMLDQSERACAEPVNHSENHFENSLGTNWDTLDSQPKILRSKQTATRPRTLATSSKKAVRHSGGANR